MVTTYLNTNLKRILFDECLANHLSADVCFKISAAARGADRIAEKLAAGAPLMRKWQRAALRKPAILASFLAADDFDVSKMVSSEDLNRALAYVVENEICSLIHKAIALGAVADETYVSLLKVSIVGEGFTSFRVKVPLICKAASIRRSARALVLLLEAGAAQDNSKVLQEALAWATDADRPDSILLLQVALSACELRRGIGLGRFPEKSSPLRSPSDDIF
jgi:hypothetical protein